ncbi:MAG: hypothetical protein EOP04_07155 [Proteobacteria bacterium]|nr:MAG: hypothetical protein EOP04_07155 [Pseudomonadota bacterium]
MFSLTPIEAAIWQAGVGIQSALAAHLFSSMFFTGFVLAFFLKNILKAFHSVNQGAKIEDVTIQVGAIMLSLALGLTFLHANATTAFKPQDSKGRNWSDYQFVKSSNKYTALQDNHNGLWWYRLLHGGSTELSKYLTVVVGKIFRDDSYAAAPDMMFKLLVNTASMQIDNPELTLSLDNMMQTCGDPQKGTVIGPSSGVGDLLDLGRPECMQQYQDLQVKLKQWASTKIPTYVKKVSETPSEGLPFAVRGFSDREVLENKIVGSALVAYAKDKSRGFKDGVNTNTDALSITDKQDHFWYLLQKAASGGGFASMLANLFSDDGSSEAAINRNEARNIYNNLLNLIPSFKGIVKAFIAISFLFAAAALAFGFSGPALWWLSVLAMDMVYEPLSTANYQINVSLMKSSEIGAAFGHLSQDPMAVMGAAIIDSNLVTYQTAYFLSQMAIAAIFVVGIVGSGFAVNKMSFSQGAGFTAMAGWATNNRILGSAGRSLGNGVSKAFGKK